ncbi:hypothetical protein [Micromonospora sp. NPDC005806]|uniref:hypothetical protein n=1 Tax=Micromonospora sp. NPDC005806 TaxID=3364234 RepID=UPI00369FC5D3
MVSVGLAFIVGAGTVLATAAPAQAGQMTSYCGSWLSHPCSVEYTGTWPSGMVRALGPLNVYALRLEANAGSGWVPRTTVYHPSQATPWVAAGKTSWYRPCVQVLQSGDWFCSRDMVYLGD